MLNTETKTLLGNRAIAKAKRGIELTVKMRDEFWMLTKGRARSIIQMCDVAGADEFFANLGVETPPLHVTLYTLGDTRGIGVASWAELEQRGSRIDFCIR